MLLSLLLARGVLGAGPVVDLGYASYRGTTDAAGIDSFLGLRFAAPPVRWQKPQKPAEDRSAIINATTYAPICPQSRPNIPGIPPPLGNEDCLFLNVHRPAHAEQLPVAVWIHGGGYGLGDGRSTPSYLYSLSSAGFVFVSIQYRLGALGFLASDEVAQRGALNVGLLDQEHALRWVQEHIAAFGGDPSRVTIWGESAGAGSVLQQLIAHGGEHNQSLFSRAILASAYLPQQHRCNDSVPTRSYNAFAAAVGCTSSSSHDFDTFDCLNKADPLIIAQASNNVSQQTIYGQWAFTPVTDGTFVRDLPSVELVGRASNQVAVLVGSNVDEGSLFIRGSTSRTSADFYTYVSELLPAFDNATVAELVQHYPEPEASGDLYSTQFDRISTLYADSVFNCPSVRTADAFRPAYRYNFAVPPAGHGEDVRHYLRDASQPDTAAQAAIRPFDATLAEMLTSFITRGRPQVRGIRLPRWRSNCTATVRQVRFNATTSATGETQPVLTIEDGRYLTNGRDRCAFWRKYASLVPE